MNSNVNGTIITDCSDGSARTRQELRFDALFGVKPAFLDVSSYSPVEAAGNLIDQLDVLTKFPHNDKNRDKIILVNVAPRADHVKKKWDNGTPFCFFKTDDALVVSSFEDYCLALVRDFGLSDHVQILDIPAVVEWAVKQGELTSQQADKIQHSQFRSLEFLPLAAYWIWKGEQVPAQGQSLAQLPSPEGQIWQIDNFGNAKTTLLPADIDFEQGKKIRLANGQSAACYARLADVPKDTTALTIGSSGYGASRFLEVVIGGCGNAAGKHELKIGAPALAKD